MFDTRSGGYFYVGDRVFRYKRYKPDGVRQMDVDGRYQEANEYGGWKNIEQLPEGYVKEIK